MDEKGRLFGKVNIIDFAVVSFAIFLLIVIVIFGIGNISTEKINPMVREREQRSIAKENALNERENSLNEREKAFKDQQYVVELSNREKEFNFQKKEFESQKKELMSGIEKDNALNILNKKENELKIVEERLKTGLEFQKKELTEGLEKEKLQNWIEGVKEGIRLKIQSDK